MDGLGGSIPEFSWSDDEDGESALFSLVTSLLELIKQPWIERDSVSYLYD